MYLKKIKLGVCPSIGRTAGLVVLVLLVGCGADPYGNPLSVRPELKRGPYVQLGSTESIWVVWQTYSESRGAVEFGPTEDLGFKAESSEVGTTHAVMLTGLQPGTYYHYRVVDGIRPLSRMVRFHTNHSEDDEDFTFLVFGDSGAGGSTMNKIGQRINSSEASLAIHTGDVIYPNGEEENYDSYFFYPYARFLSGNVLYPSFGNHDGATADGAPYSANFYLPANNPSATERYYSFDYAHAHFIALDTEQSTDPGSEQLAWLEQDLAASTKRWKFVYFHKPPYSAGYLNLDGARFDLADVSVRRNLSPLFELYGVDIVFSGHSHSYERTFPISQDLTVDQFQDPDYVNPSGPIYIVTGGGGGTILGLDSSPFNATALPKHHFVEIALIGNELKGRVMEPRGLLIDEFSILKQ